MMAMVVFSMASLAADDINSLRLFFTPEERQAVSGSNGLTDDTLHAGTNRLTDPESQGRAEHESSQSAPQIPRQARKAVTTSFSIVFNALIASADGVRVVLNGLPCSRVEQPRTLSRSEFLADLDCPHLDWSDVQFRLQLTDHKIQVLKRGRPVEVLSVGNAI